MAEKKRQCGTCRFFLETDNGYGKCTHPRRVGAETELILLRPNELACRTRWGTSLWQDKADDRDPMAPTTPIQPTLPEPLVAQSQYDDEVTSVSIAGSRSSRPSLDDDVIETGSVPMAGSSWSDDLQEERRRLLMNSSQEALAGARKRHLEKHARPQRELIPFAEDTDDDQSEPESQQAPAEPAPQAESNAKESPMFPPDDFVEEERSSASETADDEMLDDGTHPGRRRSPRMRNLMRGSNSPKDHKAMPRGAALEMAVTYDNPDQREQWNSVPQSMPGFELPLKQKTPTEPQPRLQASAAAISHVEPSRTVSQAREIMAEERLREQRAQRKFEVPLASDAELRLIRSAIAPQTTGSRSESLEQPTETAQPAATIDRLKSSPLRGYHQAAQAARDSAASQQTSPTQVRQRAVAPARQQTSQASDEQPRPMNRVRSPQSEPRRQMPHSPSTSAIASDEMHLADNRRQSEASSTAAFASAEVQQEVQHRQAQHRQMQPAATRQKPSDNRQTSQPERNGAPKRDLPLLDMTIRIAPGVPKCCGTCASYRPNDLTGTGTCMNEFAGPAPRVVDEQDLACQRMFGCLWIPANEEIWLEPLPEFNEPTPRVDAMLSRRERRIRPVLPDLDELTS